MVKRETLDPDESLWDWIAVDLHFWRNRHGLSLANVARILDTRREHVSNMEAGRRKMQDYHAAALDDLWNLNGHFSRLLRYARAGHDPDWFKQHLDLEAAASELRIYEPMLVPGLLQTPDYARVLFESGSSSDPDRDVKLRISRQGVLSKKPAPWVWVVMDQQVLERPIGGPKVMAEQLRRVLSVSKQPRVTIQVVPMAVGWYPGVDGGFKILRVDGIEYAYSEAAEGGRLAGSSADLSAFDVRYDLIRSHAWSVDETRQAVQRAMEALQ